MHLARATGITVGLNRAQEVLARDHIRARLDQDSRGKQRAIAALQRARLLTQRAHIGRQVVAIHLRVQRIDQPTLGPGLCILQVLVQSPRIARGRTRQLQPAKATHRGLQLREPIAQSIRTPCNPRFVFGFRLLGAARMLGPRLQRGCIVATRARQGWQAIITLQSVDVVGPSQLDHHVRHEGLHLGIEGIRPSEVVLLDTLAIRSHRSPLGVALQQSRGLLGMLGSEAVLQPRNDFDAAAMRFVDHLLQRIAVSVARVDGGAHDLFGDRTGIAGQPLAPHHGVDGVDAVCTQHFHRLRDLGARLQHCAAGVGDPDPAQLLGIHLSCESADSQKKAR